MKDVDIRNNVMNADWYLQHLKLFQEACTQYFEKEHFFAARVQHLKEGDISATFYCDHQSPIMQDAKERGYTMAPYSGFTEDLIRNQWEIRDHHWEIEFYVCSKAGMENIRFAFYSYDPAIVVRDRSNPLESPLESTLTTIREFARIVEQQHKASITYGRPTYEELVYRSHGFQLPLSDPRFESLYS